MTKQKSDSNFAYVIRRIRTIGSCSKKTALATFLILEYAHDLPETEEPTFRAAFDAISDTEISDTVDEAADPQPYGCPYN